MTYVQILKDRIKRGEIDYTDAVQWLVLNAEIRYCDAFKLMGDAK